MHAYADPRVSARDRAFERLYRRYVKDVYRYTLALLRNPADAEDITQTTFLNAYRAYTRGEEPLKPQNWLITIAHNACRTRYVRSARRPQEVPLERSLNELALPEDEVPDVRAVLDALAKLPFNQRAALVMRELEGRSYKEIARALDVTVPAVETLIFRARRSLRVRRSALKALGALPLPASLSSFSGGTGALAVGSGAAFGSGFLLKAVFAVGVGIAAGTAGPAVEATILGGAGAVEERIVAEAASASAPQSSAGGGPAARAPGGAAYRFETARSGTLRAIEQGRSHGRLPRRSGRLPGSALASPGAVAAQGSAAGSPSAAASAPPAGPATLVETVEKTAAPAVPAAIPTVDVPAAPEVPAVPPPPVLPPPPLPPPPPPPSLP